MTQEQDKDKDLNLLSTRELIKHLYLLSTQSKGLAPGSGSWSHSTTSDSDETLSSSDESSSQTPTDSSDESSDGGEGNDG